jgi:NAD+ synthase (glutamine-hydrolysing)
MGMATQSSKETRSRAQELLKAIGSYSVDLDIGDTLRSEEHVHQSTGFEPKFKVYGGTQAENLALRNLRARTRMVTAYEFSQLLPTVRQMGSANCDE